MSLNKKAKTMSISSDVEKIKFNYFWSMIFSYKTFQIKCPVTVDFVVQIMRE